jgi:ribonuclease HI
MGLVKPELPSISVDAACAGVPGPVEWRGVETDSGKQLFKLGPYAQGTNNIGEFLAIIQGLNWLADKQLAWPVYSDSENAIQWVKAKKCRTKLEHSTQNDQLFALIASAERWLSEHHFANKILKWDTEMWGENPADFGRK